MKPYTRASGAGSAVVLCLHGNASTLAQRRAPTDLLAPKFRVVATDELGAGAARPGIAGLGSGWPTKWRCRRWC